jgi:hypothetical protein
MIKYKVYYTLHDNFGCSAVIEISESIAPINPDNKINNYPSGFVAVVELIVWNIIKDQEYDWPTDILDVNIDKIIKLEHR